MRSLMQIATLLLILGSANAITQPNTRSSGLLPGSQIEITEIKNVGVSAANESKSIIQVSWTTPVAAEVKIQSFDLQLDVSYADRGVEKVQARANAGARNNRFEIPTQHRAAGQPAAELKSFKVTITANYAETATKQGTF